MIFAFLLSFIVLFQNSLFANGQKEDYYIDKINEKFNGNGNTKKPVKFNNSKFQNKGNSTGFKKNSGSSKIIKSNRRPK